MLVKYHMMDPVLGWVYPAEEVELRIEQLEDGIRSLLLLIEHETDLPSSAANGVVAPNGADEGEVRAAEILSETRGLVRDKL